MSALFLLLKEMGSGWEFSLPTTGSLCVEPGFLQIQWLIKAWVLWSTLLYPMQDTNDRLFSPAVSSLPQGLMTKKYTLKLFSRDYKLLSEKAMAPHSSTLAWKIPWTEEPGRLQSIRYQRVGYDWVTSLSLFTFMHWRRKWQRTPVFLPGES